MRLYEILVPVLTNDGKSTHGARLAFEGELVRLSGGYTRLEPVEGAWVEEPGGGVQVETMQPYRFTGEPGTTVCMDVLAAAMRLFSDQKAVFIADLGEAMIHAREKGPTMFGRMEAPAPVLAPFEIQRAEALLVRARNHLHLIDAAHAKLLGALHALHNVPSNYVAGCQKAHAAAKELEALLP
jgi:hypothetical protein